MWREHLKLSNTSRSTERAISSSHVTNARPSFRDRLTWSSTRYIFICHEKRYHTIENDYISIMVYQSCILLQILYISHLGSGEVKQCLIFFSFLLFYIIGLSVILKMPSFAGQGAQCWNCNVSYLWQVSPWERISSAHPK